MDEIEREKRSNGMKRYLQEHPEVLAERVKKLHPKKPEGKQNKQYIEIKSIESIEIKLNEKLLYHNSVTLIKPENKLYVNLNKRIKHWYKPSKFWTTTNKSLLIPIENYDDFVDTLIELRDRIHESGIKQIKTQHITEAITRRQNKEIQKMTRSSFSFLD